MKNLLVSCSVLAALTFSTFNLRAHPYASGVTNNNGSIQFILNEPADNVWVVFNDGTTNTLGPQTSTGLLTFPLGSHTHYSIYVKKVGNGVPSQISSDDNPFNSWNSPRGVAVNRNPQVGYLFGRVYVDNSAVGGSGLSTRGRGIYMLNADQSDSPQMRGTNAFPSGFWAASTSSPYRMSVAPDNSLIVGDYSTAAATVWQFDADFLQFTNQMLAVLGENTGAASGIHGDIHGHPVVTGSLATSNLVLWTADEKLPASATEVLGYITGVGDVDNIFRYDIGAGPLPWSNAPNFCVGIWPSIGIPDLGDTDVAIHPQTGNIYAMGGRINFANPNLQVFDPTGTQLLFSSLEGPVNIGPDPISESFSIDISPDGQFVALGNINSAIFVMAVSNGVPDITTLATIPNTPDVGDNRGIGFDAADNIYAVSSGQGLMRVFSLGLTTTAITGNDVTGTNGTFQLVLPPLKANVVATTPLASQNYGTPTPAVFTITLNTNFLASPTVVNFVLGGTATNGTFTSSVTNSVTFPAGTSPSGNWSTNIVVTPTATPVSGPTLDVTLTISGGAAYLASSPVVDTVYIANTGPDVISISAASGSSMYRGVTNDYAVFTITRLGDTNGAAPSHIPSLLTITNFIYGGTAIFGRDYTAGVQAVPTTITSSPVNGPGAVTFSPGDITKTVIVGNPVRTPTGAPPVGNETIAVTLGPVNTTQGVSQEGYPYTIASNNSVTVSEIDNAYPAEIVLWSDALTNAAASTNWTVTFASSNSTLGPTVSPSVIPDYTNGLFGGPSYASDSNGSNDFDVEFGYSIASDGIGVSPDMAANQWTTALKMTVNKDSSYFIPSGVNALLQGHTFSGNYAVRFSANLSQGSYNTPEFALFGMDQFGTNCDWENSPYTGSTYTNLDGNWWAVSTGPGGSITPADFDMFTGGAKFPNNGLIEVISDPGAAFANVFKHPPYTASGVGLPSDGDKNGANTWCDVELRQYYSQGYAYPTNTLSINHTVIFNFANTNIYTGGTIMLGYEDPLPNGGDTAPGSYAAAYYSNIRVVELAPGVTGQPTNISIPVGGNGSFTAVAVGTAPFTNLWYFTASGSTNPAVAVNTNTVSASSDAATLNLNAVTIANAGSYYVVIGDIAGSVTSSVATLTVLSPPAILSAPTNVTSSAGSTVSFTVGASGYPLGYQWSFTAGGTTQSVIISNATSATLSLTNIQAASAGTYSVVVSNSLGMASSSATLTLIAASPSFGSATLSGANLIMNFTSANTADTINSYTLQSASVVTGPWTDDTGAVFSTGSGGFEVTIPDPSATQFYRLQHN